MFGSIYVGMSGLGAYSRGLQQISNNVSNINSIGFKGATVSFTDMVSYGGGGYASEGDRGGGHGVSMGNPRTDFRAGDLRQTQRDLDLAVDGEGFMMLMRGDEVLYTRTGSFEIDKDGFIVLQGTDYRLATLNASGQPTTISIDNSRTHSPQASTRINFQGNIPEAGLTVSNVTVLDGAGGAHVLTMSIAKPADAAAGVYVATFKKGETAFGSPVNLEFDDNGRIKPTTGMGTLTDTATGLSLSLNFLNATNYEITGPATLTASADGFGPGALVGVKVNSSGHVELSYSNSQKKDLGAVALATFRDPQVLEARSGGLFVNSTNAAAELMSSQDDRAGQVMSQRLEASNVDLAKQFGDLILIQRGFQASSQIISVSNDMIQQLFGIRGQG